MLVQIVRWSVPHPDLAHRSRRTARYLAACSSYVLHISNRSTIIHGLSLALHRPLTAWETVAPPDRQPLESDRKRRVKLNESE